jgi:hypothetical protein
MSRPAGDMAREITNLEQLLDRIAQAATDRDRVSIGSIVESVGRKSFGPLLLLAGVLTVSPLSGIPGMPTTMGVFTLLIAIQLLVGREYFWLPAWLLKRSVTRKRLETALKWMRPPARQIDRFLRPRLSALLHGPGNYAIAIVCTLMAVTMPFMEVVPFSVNGIGAALATFGVSLIADDGLVALLAFMLTSLAIGLLVYYLF